MAQRFVASVPNGTTRVNIAPSIPLSDISPGKPVTVSATGSSTTGTINNGADYGPDTAGTVTQGIAEALPRLQRRS